jgi:dephospho-CoA kinase
VSEDTQVARTMQRDNNSGEQVRAIIAAQIGRAERLARADDVIENNGSLEDLEPKVLALHHRYLEIAAAMAAGSNAV